MQTYIIRRFILLIPTILLVTLMVFFMMRLIPGNILDAMVRDVDWVADAEGAREALERSLGLDLPMHVQYFRWIGNIVLHGSLGESLWRHTPVLDTVVSRMPVTMELGILSLIISLVIAIPIGVYSAIRADTPGDYLARSFAIVFIAVPGFWTSLIVIFLGSIWFRWSPPLRFTPLVENPIENLGQFIIPAIILGTHMTGIAMRMTRSMMLEVLRQDYTRTAWAKGLRERVVIIRHVLRNAAIPVITIVGGEITVIVGGAVIIEQIFGLPGMGRLFLGAVETRDYPSVTGIVLLVGFFSIALNLLTDLTYSYIDPRIRYR